MVCAILAACAVGLAALPHGGGAAATATCNNITSDTHFYGQSPPVYPSPNATAAEHWANAVKKAQALVSQMTLEEKVNLTAGTTAPNGCSGNIAGVARLKFPGLCLSDAGNGLRGTEFVSSWPSGIHVGASWNKDLASKRGKGMGGEFRTKGVNMMLGPVVGPVGRVVTGGRNWEGFSVDPYLSGALVYETVSAVQSVGVIASTKHYLGNEQETHRNPTGSKASVSSNIDDKTMHELYLWPFQDAVHAGTGNIMCSYNRVNNSYGCANSKTLNGLLKTELGFQGFVVSDWYAQHAGVASALAGLDMAMPDSEGFWGANLTQAVNNGSVPASRVTDMATRIVAAWYQMGQDQGFPEPGIGMPADLTAPHDIVDGRDLAYRSVIYQGAVEGHVLVKNKNNALPLKAPRLLSLFGYSAKAPDTEDIGSGFGSWGLGAESFNVELLIAGFTGQSAGSSPSPAIAINGTIVSGGGSGATSQSRIISPFDGIVAQADVDNTALFWDFTSDNPFVAASSDACLVFVNAYATESIDRPNLHDDYTDGLINNVASNCSNTIVIFQNAGVRLVDQFVDHPNVTALVFAHLPGQDSGKALVSLLYGRENPSGRLPYTVAHNESDYGRVLSPDQPAAPYILFPQSNFTEGVFIDYRHFDANNITPRYEFGYGLSYTTFSYSDLAISKVPSTKTSAYPTGPVLQGGQADLWDVVARVTAVVTNTGSLAGAEVAQLYVGVPGQGNPVRQLRGFEKPIIKAGQQATVTFELTRRDLSVWDVAAQAWHLGSGSYNIWVGASSRNLPLKGNLVI